MSLVLFIISLENFLLVKVSDFLVHVSACKVHGDLEVSNIYQENLKTPLHFLRDLCSKSQTAIPL